jgi:hypothetical protein
MSVEKFHLVNKAQRGFDAIADALLDDDYEDDLLVDEEGNVYMLVDEEEIEKGIPKAIQARGTGGAYGTARRKAWRTGHQAARLNSGEKDAFGQALVDWRKARGAKARVEARDIVNGVQKADDSHRNAKLGAAGGAIGAAGLTALQAKKIANGYAFARAIGVPKNEMNRAMAGGLGRRFGAATGGGALGGAAVDYARSKNKVEKGLPSVQRNLLREAQKTGNFDRINSHWGHSLKIDNKRIGQEVAGKRGLYPHQEPITPDRALRLKSIGSDKAVRRKELLSEKTGKTGLRPSTIQPGKTVGESRNELAGIRESRLRSQRPVNIRGGTQNRPAW